MKKINKTTNKVKIKSTQYLNNKFSKKLFLHRSLKVSIDTDLCYQRKNIILIKLMNHSLQIHYQQADIKFKMLLKFPNCKRLGQ